MAGVSSVEQFSDVVLEELESLKAIYNDEVEIDTTKDDLIKVTYQTENYSKIIFYISGNYPDIAPTVKSSRNCKDLIKLLENTAEDMIGSSMLYSLISIATDFHVNSDDVKSLSNDANKEITMLKYHAQLMQDVDKPEKQVEVKKKMKKKKEKDSETKYADKKKSMRTAIDVINRILWDDSLLTENFIVGYLDRFIGVIEKPFSAFSWEDIASVDYTVLAIPKHRIQYFKYKNTKIWDKNDRMDKVYGSTGDTETLLDIIESYTNLEEPVKKEMTEADDEKKKEGKSYSDRDRPNYFLCLPVDNVIIKKKMKVVQDYILSCDDRLDDGIIQPSTAHITLCMMRLENENDKTKATEVLKSLEVLLVCMLPLNEPALTVSDVDNFRGLVVYAEVQHNAIFQKFAEIAKAKLKDAGIRLVGNYDIYKPHITLLKLSRPLCKELKLDSLHPSLFEKFRRMYFGEQSVSNLRICSTGKERGDDQFYVTLAKLTNNLLCVSSKLTSLIGGHVKKLAECDLVSTEFQDEDMENIFSNDKIKFESAILSLEKIICSTVNAKISSGKIVIIMRGLPGSGKSYFVQHLLETKTDEQSVKVCSADEYFLAKGSYTFSSGKIGAAHKYCRDKFIAGLEEGTDVLVIDNTHSQKWEYQIYKRMALLCGYESRVIEITCKDESQRQLYCKRGLHHVSALVHKEMFSRWEIERDVILVQSDSSVSIDDVINQDGIQATNARVLYSAIYLDEPSKQLLLKNFPPAHGIVTADHMTITHDPNFDSVINTPVGSHRRLKVSGHLSNTRIQVASVEELDDETFSLKTPHVTISRNKKTPAKHAERWLKNDLIKSPEKEFILCGIVGVQIALSQSTSQACTDPFQFRAFTDMLGTEHDLYGSDYICDGRNEGEKLPNELQEAGIYFGPHVVKSLYIFDFDGTLFHTPDPVLGRKQYEKVTGTPWPHNGFLARTQSLQNPLHIYPGPALKEYFDHRDRACSMSVLLTARMESVRDAVQDITTEHGMSFDEFMLKPMDKQPTGRKHYGGGVNKYKRNYVSGLMTKYGDVERVKFWDDKEANVDAIDSLRNSHSKVNFQLHHVQEKLPDPYKFSIENMLDRMGYRQSEAYKLAVQEGVNFISKAWTDLLRIENQEECALPFGSFLLHRRTDVDLCLVAPVGQSVDRYIGLLGEKLKSYGVKYINVASGIRCPRLKLKFEYLHASPVEFDIVIATIADSCNRDIKTIYSTCSDKVSKRALDGLVFFEDVVKPVESKISLEDFGMIIDALCIVLTREGLKGNAFHCVRTFQLVNMLSRFIQSSSIDLFMNGFESMRKFEKVLLSCFEYFSKVSFDEWKKLFKGFVPDIYIQPLVRCFEEASRSNVQQLLFIAPNSVGKHEQVCVELLTNDPVAKWKSMTLTEARLGTLIRTLIDRGFKVYLGYVTSHSIFFGTSSIHDSEKLIRTFINDLQKELGSDVEVRLTLKGK